MRFFYKKGLTTRRAFDTIIGRSGNRVRNMREWRNWQTRTFEGRVVHTVRVQVPFLAPKGLASAEPFRFVFSTSETLMKNRRSPL